MSTPNPTPYESLTPEALDELLVRVESTCTRAVGIVNVAARLVVGDELGLRDAEMPTVCNIALEHVADELETLAGHALRARTGGGAA